MLYIHFLYLNKTDAHYNNKMHTLRLNIQQTNYQFITLQKQIIHQHFSILFSKKID